MNDKSGKLVIRKMRIFDLGPVLINDMWKLFAQNYEKVTKEQFYYDLLEKTHCFVAFDSGDKSFQGFSTYKIYLHNYAGTEIGIFYSGDTMIKPEYWGDGAMQLAIYKEAVLWKLKNPGTPFYWFLIAMGYRTYLAMAKSFGNNYWPRHNAVTPAWELGFISSISKEKFGDDWQETERVIRFKNCNCIFKSDVAPIVGPVLELEEIKFFVKANPGYAQGDELSCIARLDLDVLLGLIPKATNKFYRKYKPLKMLRQGISNGLRNR